MKPHILYSIFSLLILVSCEDVINIDLPESDRLVVVEGWVTNEAGPQKILLSQTAGFNNSDTISYIHDARVVVLEEFGQSFPYTYHDQGVYLSDSSFSGIVGRSYQVIITLNDGERIR